MKSWAIKKRWIWPMAIYFGAMTAFILYVITGVLHAEFAGARSPSQVWDDIVIAIIVLAVFFTPFPISFAILSWRIHKKLGDIKVNTARKYLISYFLNILLIAVSIYEYLKVLSINYTNLVIVLLLISGNLHSGHRRFLWLWEALFWIRNKFSQG